MITRATARSVQGQKNRAAYLGDTRDNWKITRTFLNIVFNCLTRNKEKQFIDINNSFNVLNKVYIDNLKKSNDEKNILLERINNLSKTMDSIRELNENKIKNIRSYYQKEIDTLKKLNETPKDFNITDNYSDKNSKL